MRIRPFLGNSDRGDVESELGRIPILSGLVNYDETSVVIGLIKLEKTVYSPPDKSDGKRILVMTLWPRGVSKGRVDVWMKELGTPRDLITRYKAGKLTWKEYSAEYIESLKGKESILRSLAE